MLSDIARDMENEALRRATSTRELPRGLCMQLTWCGGFKILTLSRPAVRPAEQEVAICKSAFQVPDSAAVALGDVSVTMRWPSAGEGR